MERAKATPWWKNWAWLAKWAVVFALGCVALESGIGLLKIVGAFIVFPTLLAVSIFIYGGFWWKVVKLFGGDPQDIWFPWFILLSFATLLFLLSGIGHHRY
jgi:hypothetical protein